MKDSERESGKSFVVYRYVFSGERATALTGTVDVTYLLHFDFLHCSVLAMARRECSQVLENLLIMAESFFVALF